jgi:hypothetical protein
MSSRRSRTRVATVAVLAGLLLPAGIARANAFTEVAQAIASNGGSLPACQFSAATLNAALSQIPTDAQQYSQEISNAINQALQEQASGACNKGSSKSGGVVPVIPTTPGATPSAPAPATINPPPAPPALQSPAAPGVSVPLRAIGSTTVAGLPAPILILAGLGGLGLLVAMVVGASRLLGWDPRWLVALRHSWSEAGFRVGGTWLEFTDWLRFQR